MSDRKLRIVVTVRLHSRLIGSCAYLEAQAVQVIHRAAGRQQRRSLPRVIRGELEQ
jgi:hypothetical protein